MSFDNLKWEISDEFMIISRNVEYFNYNLDLIKTEHLKRQSIDNNSRKMSHDLMSEKQKCELNVTQCKCKIIK